MLAVVMGHCPILTSSWLKFLKKTLTAPFRFNIFGHEREQKGNFVTKEANKEGGKQRINWSEIPIRANPEKSGDAKLTDLK